MLVYDLEGARTSALSAVMNLAAALISSRRRKKNKNWSHPCSLGDQGCASSRLSVFKCLKAHNIF